MSIEICAHCDGKIGLKEPAMLWNEKVVCTRCMKKLCSLDVEHLRITDLTAVPLAQFASSVGGHMFQGNWTSTAKPRFSLPLAVGIGMGIFAVGIFAISQTGAWPRLYDQLLHAINGFVQPAQAPQPAAPAIATQAASPVNWQVEPDAKSAVENLVNKFNGTVQLADRRILLDARIWASLTFDAKADLLEKFDRYCEFIAKKSVGVRIIDSRSSQTLAESLPGHAPQIYP